MVVSRRFSLRPLVVALTLAFSSHAGLVLALPAYGVTINGELIAFDTDAPAAVTSLAITGLAPGEAIVAIDMVVTNGLLYALSDQGRLYTLNPASGAALQIGAGTIGLALNGTRFGLDYDPVADVLRVSSNTAQNFRIDYKTGTAIDGAPAPGIQGDTNFSPGLPQVAGAAHTNNFDGAGFTRLYVIDSASDTLKFTETPDGGVLTNVGPLGLNVGIDTSFDIVAENIAYMVAPSAGTTLYDINLSTGTATAIGSVGNNLAVRAFAVYAPLMTLRAVTADGLLVRFGNIFPNVLLSQDPITGLQPGETIVGIDFRPTTRELYAVGSSSRLYTVAADGEVTQVGLAPFALPLDGTHFGVDFDPVTDRLRVISNTGQNLRIHPDTGKVIDGDPNTDGVQPDTPINPAGSVVGLAYTNSAPGATESTLIGLEVTQDRLVRIGGVNGAPSANGGVVTDLAPIGVNASAITAFDMAQVGHVGGNTGYAAVEAGNTSNLHRVTADGFIAEFRPINKQVVAMAIEPGGSVAFTQIFVYVNEGGIAQLAVSRESASGHAYVEYRVTGGTAANGADYALQNGVLEFPSGITLATIPLPTLQDPTDEVGETIVVTLENPSANHGARLARHRRGHHRR